MTIIPTMGIRVEDRRSVAGMVAAVHLVLRHPREKMGVVQFLASTTQLAAINNNTKKREDLYFYVFVTN